jgi:hypothetical protein
MTSSTMLGLFLYLNSSDVEDSVGSMEIVLRKLLEVKEEQLIKVGH